MHHQIPMCGLNRTDQIKHMWNRQSRQV